MSCKTIDGELVLTCDMDRECKAAVTHIDEKGFVYCAPHGIDRRTYSGRYCRRMRPWEVKRLTTVVNGYHGTISYERRTKAEQDRIDAERAAVKAVSP